MALQKTRTFLLGRFEAGDRPTDQDFANLFESIIFLNNDGIHVNGLATDNTTIAGNFAIGGTLDLTGNFKMGAKLSVGDTSQALNSTISAYNSDNFAVYYASGSLTDTMFEGISQDVTSSIKLTETLAGSTPAVPSTNTLIFGTSAGRAFLQNDGQEILHMTSSGHNGNSPQVYISGSLGIGSGWDSGTAATGEHLHIQALGEGNATMRLTSDGTANDSIIKLRQSNDTGFDLIYDGGIDRFQLKNNTGNAVIQVEHASSANMFYIDDLDRIGIGHNSPDTRLHIKGSTTNGSTLKIEGADATLARPKIQLSTLRNTGAIGSHVIEATDISGGVLEGQMLTIGVDETMRIQSNGQTLMHFAGGSTQTRVVIGGGSEGAEATLHIIGMSDNTRPMMLIEGGGGVAEQDTLILRDLGTAAGNLNNVLFQATSGEHNIAQIQVETKSSNATSGGTMNLFTYSDDSGTANSNQLFLKNDGRIGIGTNTPGETLDVQGVVNSTTNLNASNPDDEGEYRLGSRADFGLKATNYKAQLQAPNDVIMMIDSNANDDAAKFMVQKHSSTVNGGTTLLSVDQNGGVTGSFFVGDGSGLTGIIGSQISGFVNNADDNRIVTVVDNTGNAIRGESDFTFDGTDVKLNGNLAIGKGTAGLFTPDTPLHIFHDGDSLGDQDLIHLSMQSTTAEGNISIKFSDNADVAGQHFKMTFGEGNNDLKFHSDSDDNILYLEHDGDVGIGTNNPTARLHVVDSGTIGISDLANAHILVGNTSTGLGFDPNEIMFNGHDGNIGVISNHDFAIITNASTRMFIEAGGDVGIGTTAPRAKLDVVGRITVDNTTTGVPAITLFGDDDVANHPDIMFQANGIIAASGSLFLNIDADNNSTANSFHIRSNSSVFNGGDSLFYVQESDGFTGIGTNSPTEKLHIAGTTTSTRAMVKTTTGNAVFRMTTDTGDYLILSSGTADVFQVYDANAATNPFRIFGANATNTLVLKSDKVGIGTDTPTHNLHIKSIEDAAIFLEADTNNSGEDDNAFIKLTHDNQSNIAYLGTVGNADKTPENDASTDTLGNSLYLGQKTAHPLHLVTNNIARMTILSDGKIGVNTNAPAWDGIHIDNGHLGIDNGVSHGRIGFHINDRIDNYTVIEDSQTTAATAEKIAHYGLTRPSTAIEDPITLSGYFGLEFITQGTKRMRINKNGHIGIEHPFKPNTSDDAHDIPTVPLDVGGKIGVSRFGLLGSYDSGAGEVQGIWSIGKSYPIDLTNNDFGTAYGIGYGHSNAGAEGTAYLGFSGQHQILFINNGTPNAAIGLNGQAYFNSHITSEGYFSSVQSSTSGAYYLGGQTDAGMAMASNHVQIMARGHVVVMIDSNNNETTRSFMVQKDSGTVNGGTTIFKVEEDGDAFFNQGMSILSRASQDAQGSNYDGVFDGETGTIRRHRFYFPAATNSNDPGLIAHETCTTVGLRNASVIRLCPGDDVGSQDYVAIGGYDEQERIRLFTTGEGHFRGGLGVGNEWNESGINIDGAQIADGVIHVKSTNDAGLILEADFDNNVESHNAFIRMTQDNKLVGGVMGLSESATSGPEGDTIRNGTTNGMAIYTSDSYLDSNGKPAKLHLGAGSTMAMTILDKLMDNDVGVIIGPETNHTKFGSDTYPALSIKMKTQSTLALSTSCAVNVKQNSNRGGGLALIDNDSDKSIHIENFNGTDLLFGFRSDSATSKVDVKGYIRHDVNSGAITFTGQHKNVPETGVADDYIHHVGKIVISTGTYKNLNLSQISDKPNINEALPKVALSSQANDKRVWGVVSDAEDSSDNRRTDAVGVFVSVYDKQDNRIIVNSVGEGGILVSNYNGDLENGDYVTTCPLEGLGMKQDDDLLHNYTVAKVTQDVTFLYGDPDVKEITYNGQIYKYKFVGCTYHCG